LAEFSKYAKYQPFKFYLLISVIACFPVTYAHRKTLIRNRIETKRSQYLVYKRVFGAYRLRTTEAYLASFEKEERTKNTNLLTSFL